METSAGQKKLGSLLDSLWHGHLSLDIRLIEAEHILRTRRQRRQSALTAPYHGFKRVGENQVFREAPVPVPAQILTIAYQSEGIEKPFNRTHATVKSRRHFVRRLTRPGDASFLEVGQLSQEC